MLGVGGWTAVGLGDDRQPVVDGLTGESGPGPVRLDQGAGVGLAPQDEQRPMGGVRQPALGGLHHYGHTDTAQLRILLVDPDARGHNLGSRLVDYCLSFARGAGYQRMKLWTNDPLVASRHVYLSRGFTLVEEEPHHSFGVDLIGQVYELDL